MTQATPMSTPRSARVPRQYGGLLLGMSHSMAIEGVGQVLGAVTADSRWQGLSMAAYGLGSQLGVALPHSRKQESEADYIGLLYMARAGYDPQAALGFWRRFAAHNTREGGGAPWFLRTHPLDAARLQQIEAWLPRARAEYRPR
jgi:predicted Zn-dependent protease